MLDFASSDLFDLRGINLEEALFLFPDHKEKMAERVETSVPEGENTIEEREVGAMWELEQKLDQPMDEEATKINSMYRENVNTFTYTDFEK